MKNITLFFKISLAVTIIVIAGCGRSSEKSLNEIFFRDLVLKTGVKLHYAERGDVAGEVIIFLHGFADSWYSFSRVLPLLSSKYHAYALDQRGHGNSERPECCYTMDVFAADVVAFMDTLGIKKATIVGHSMGGLIAQKIAPAYPNRITKIILIGSAPDAVENQALLGLQQAVQAFGDSIPREFVYEGQSSTAFNPLPKEFLSTVVSESMKIPPRVWKEALAGLLAEDTSAHLSQITAPTLIIWGDKDGIFTREEQATLVKQIPHATLKVYEATGHAVQWERPQEFAEDLKMFMQIVSR